MPTIGPCPSQDELRSRAPALLRAAEEAFGTREAGWDFAGVLHRDDGPIIYFPPLSSNAVQIALAESCRSPKYFPDQFLYQLAHEVVHLLEPNRDPPTTMLEEGAAVWFSINGPTFWSDGHKADCVARVERCDGNYGVAYRAYCELIAAYPQAVKTIRQSGIRMREIDPDLMARMFPNVSRETREVLCEKRQMR